MQENEYFDFNALKNYVLSLRPSSSLNHVVSQQQQEKEICSLLETIGGRRFFFVTNLETFEIEQAHGVQRWLGYSEQDFTMKKYLENIVHPGRRKSMIIVARQLYESLCKGTYSLNFMVQRYNSLVALKHYNGNYLLANKISAVFQYDLKNSLTAYLNEFTIIGEYTNQPMNPAFFTSKGENELRGESILQRTIEQFLKLGIFTEREFHIARRLAYYQGSTRSEIAKSLGISIHTVDEYGDRFRTKAAVFFHQQFAKASDAAIYLKKEGLI